MRVFKSLVIEGVVAATLTAPATAGAQFLSAAPAPVCTNHGTVPFMSALDCSGAWLGNNSNQQVNVLKQLAADFNSTAGVPANTAWSYFVDASYIGGNSGTINFGQSYVGFFAVAIKAANQFSLYLFDGGTAGISSVAFQTDGASVNNNGIPNGLSHASVYGLEDSFGTTVVVATPEPASAVLMVTGLVGVFAIRRRRRA